jgi:predicted dehydrogenase
VTTQPVMHPVASIAAMDAGLHVFTEGPMAAHLRDADAMIEAARRNGVKLSVQYCTRFFREARQAKLAISSGWLGKIVMGRIDANWFHTMASYFNKDAYRGTWLGEGGGSVFHHGRYASDLYLHLMGDQLAEVAAFTGRFMHDIEYEDASSASLRFASGALGHVTTTICAHRNDAIPYDRVEILGEKASLQVYRGVDWSSSPHGTTYVLSVDSEDAAYAAELRQKLEEAIPPDDTDIQVYQMRLFLDAVQHGGDVPISGESGRMHVELTRATYKSAFTRTVVKLPLAVDDPFYGPEGTKPEADSR